MTLMISTIQIRFEKIGFSIKLPVFTILMAVPMNSRKIMLEKRVMQKKKNKGVLCCYVLDLVPGGQER